ncbi:MAG TPA: hypothetical protein VMG12_39955 [Polyangiaceae bacterium]|nr:hypothetical protein [Polyangiaceae bacterium]
MQGTLNRWRTQTFTPTEAAAFAQLSAKQVRKELENRFLQLRSRKRPRLPFSALVYLRVVRLSGLSLAVADRARLYRLITEGLAQTPAPERVEFASVMSLSLGWLASEMATTLARFDAWKSKLITDPGLSGETLFPQCQRTVRHIGELLERGESPSAILLEHPGLCPQDIEFSQLFVKAYPRVGRPRRRGRATNPNV